MDEPYVLITYTTGFGEVPKEVSEFLNNEQNKKNLKYIAGSGNKNWGNNYGKAVDKIVAETGAIELMRFELSGNKFDVQKFNKSYQEIGE